MTLTNEGIVLLAKQAGITSFSALWQIKDSLKIKKTGHTGTLDTFADGLLVALTGRYTRLVPFITDCDKEYIAYLNFGSETDTLDPEGQVIKKAPLPEKKIFLDSLEQFIGEIDQVPPIYSAVHVDGKRASDRVRGGETIALQSRKIIIHELELLSVDSHQEDNLELVDGAILRVVCSKGTYIRSLARDIAGACGSCAHLAALRRTRIGPFSLDEAAGSALLPDFSKEAVYRFGKGERPPRAERDEIRASLIAFSRSMSVIIGLPPISLVQTFRDDFIKGKKIQESWFEQPLIDRHAVFCGDEFMGTVVKEGEKIFYGFVFGGQP